jgi:hypothetical protein
MNKFIVSEKKDLNKRLTNVNANDEANERVMKISSLLVFFLSGTKKAKAV